jgi:dGTPase
LEEQYRTCWRRDYARLIHSAAFRRLQGKTQLFPGKESDFFRNRLTHSLEVAQIAKSIAIRINSTESYFKQQPISTDLVETAALAHDLGHPPFGHNGEKALDQCMRDVGGFEGNAQSLRILAKLEKRQTRTARDDIAVSVLDGSDNRAGLNLTYRTMASVLKYDNEIPSLRDENSDVVKGYYYTESDLVRDIKKHLGVGSQPLKTIECSIMDVADDIAYSTYDLEDSFKARFLSPASMVAIDEPLAQKVANEVSKRLRKSYPELTNDECEFDIEDVYLTLLMIFEEVFDTETLHEFSQGEWDEAVTAWLVASEAVTTSRDVTENGYYRSTLTSELVGSFIRSVQLTFNPKLPLLSSVRLDVETFKRLEVLKNYTFQALIMSPMLKVAEYRGRDIVSQIFSAIRRDEGHLLMPSDFQELYSQLREPAEKRRVICDFIAGMTDRYAVQFYGRLFGTNPETIFSPL